jgi:hypothetical protein
MKQIKRFTQTVKRTVKSSTQHRDEEFQMLTNLATQQEKTLISFDKHVSDLVRHIQGEMEIARNCANDYKTIYMNQSNPTLEEFPVVRELQAAIEKHQHRYVTPFVEKCHKEIQQPIRSYLQELTEANKGQLTKQRHKKQLDYEYHRDKYTNLQSKPNSQPVQIEEAKRNYEQSKIAFEDVDEQAKVNLRQVVVKRYTVFHPVMTELYGEILSEYYTQMAQFGQLLAQIRHIEPPTDTTEYYIEEEEQHMPSTQSYTTTTTMYPPATTTTSTRPNIPLPRPNNFPPPPTTVLPKHLDVEWFYLDDQHNQIGPVQVAELKKLMRSGQVNIATYICNPNMSNWESIGQHELQKYL